MTNPIPAAAIEAGAKARAEARGTDWENLKHTFPGMAKNIRTETRATLKAAMPELLDQIERLEGVIREQARVLDGRYARLAAVEELHVPPPGLGPAYCTECDQLHPCDTTKAARGE